MGFLAVILVDLRRGGLLFSYRGTDGGHGLARPAAEISVGDILRVAEGVLTTVRGQPTALASYGGTARGRAPPDGWPNGQLTVDCPKLYRGSISD